MLREFTRQCRRAGTVHRRVVDLLVVQQRASPHSADCTRETMVNPQVQCIDWIVDVSVMMERHVPVTMQCQVPTMKRVQRTMSSTQVQHIDKEVDVPVAMRDRVTDEESAHEHLADSMRGTARRISRQVERQLQVWRTLRDSETDTKRNWMVWRQEVQDSFNCGEDHSMSWTNGPSRS